MNTQDFIKKAKKIHGDKYDYSKTEYVNATTKVCIICPEHGEFWMTPNNHTHGTHPQNCPKCVGGVRSNTDDFIKKAKKIHGDKYDYSKVDYVNNKTDVCIICPKHGEFWMTPSNHINKSKPQGCPKCSHIQRIKSLSSTTEEFIKKAREVHGDKYDYSRVKYTKASNKVCIICPEHGEFWQTANAHLCGANCPKCVGGVKLNTSEFIKEARKVHGDKYDYSKVDYVNNKTDVCIICPKHGEFWQKPTNHLSGRNCPICSGSFKRTTEWFIKKAREVHGDKYDYSKTEYTKAKKKVCIICPEHGEFWQEAFSHLAGAGCPKCVGKNKTTDEIVQEFRKIHGDKYDYSKVEYVDSSTKICIICPKHGEFWQKPTSHLVGYGCKKCANEEMSDKQKMPLDDFIKKAKEVHKNKYDYSKVNYNSAHEKVCIICPEHGEFWQEPASHLSGCGCPNCQGLRKQYKFNLLQEFESEYELRAFLENNDVNILYVILRNVEPKFEPIKRDIEKALKNIELKDPIQALEDKYAKDDEEETEETSTDAKEEEVTTVDITNVDLDDEDAVNDAIGTKETEYEEDTNTESTIEDVVKNTEKELEVISKIEHMLTPEDREYIMEKFLNDKLRDWMTNREISSN